MPRKTSQYPHVTFTVNPEYLGEDGLWNPRDEDPPLEAGFQLNVFGTRDHYLRLADAIRAFAEKNTGRDPEHHEHFQFWSVDRKVRLHVILRKDDVGTSAYKDFFPKG